MVILKSSDFSSGLETQFPKPLRMKPKYEVESGEQKTERRKYVLLA